MLFVITFSYILLKWIALDEANTRTAVLTQELTKLQKVISKSKKASEVSLLVKVRHRVVVWCRTLNTSNINYQIYWNKSFQWYVCLISCSIYNKLHEGKWNPSKKITISRRGFPITKPITVRRTFKGKGNIKIFLWWIIKLIYFEQKWRPLNAHISCPTCLSNELAPLASGTDPLMIGFATNCTWQVESKIPFWL